MEQQLAVMMQEVVPPSLVCPGTNSSSDTPQLTDLRDIGIVETPKVAGEWTVDKALDTIVSGKPAEGSTSPVPYFHMLERLKTTKREGWRRFNIHRQAITASCPRFVDSANVS